MPDEIVYNPRYPGRGLQALAEEGIGPVGMARGGRPRGRHRGGRRPAERQAERKARAADTVPLNIEYAISNARNRHDKPALLAALKAKERWLIRHIGITKSLSNKIALTDELTGVQDEIASLQAEGTQDTSADLQAQLDQSNARLGVANASAALANAFVATGVFGGGGGGNHYTIQSLVPPDHTWLSKLAGYTSVGLGTQGFRPATTERIGV